MKRAWQPLLLSMVLLATLLWTGSVPVRGTGFVVNSNADDADAHDDDPGDGFCEDKIGACTLRAAIEEANADPEADTITFWTGMTIIIDGTVGSLPALTNPVTIDASSVWDSVFDQPGVVINGWGGTFAGLTLSAPSCAIYGLYVTNFQGSAIDIRSASNTIGAAGPGQRNVLSGNELGLEMWGSSARANVVRNNYIGLVPGGDATNPNTGMGVLISNGASDNVLGGSTVAEANFVSGNNGYGILISRAGTDGNWMSGNWVGLGPDGNTDFGNANNGIYVLDGPNSTTIGGETGGGNLISFNDGHGVMIHNAGPIMEVSKNIIGTNQFDGISLSGTSGCLVTNNFISGNLLAGVRVAGPSASENLIWINSISANGGKGIALQVGGNDELGAPTITRASRTIARGTGACSDCSVAVYSDPADEGQIYQGITSADSAGNWVFTGLLVGPNTTATTIAPSGNTSEFSAPYDISAFVHGAFVPLALRNYP